MVWYQDSKLRWFLTLRLRIKCLITVLSLYRYRKVFYFTNKLKLIFSAKLTVEEKLLILLSDAKSMDLDNHQSTHRCMLQKLKFIPKT